MAAPQRENGFTGIANEVLEAVMRRRFGSEQLLDVVLCLWRETWGWNRIEAHLSLGLLERQTGIPKHKCSDLVRHLLELNVFEMVCPSIGSTAAIYRFQKDYDLWQVPLRGEGGSPTGEFPPRGTGGSLQGNGGGSLQGNPSKKGLKKSSSGGSSTGEPPPETTIPDLASKLERQLVQLQPSGLSQEDRKTLAELMRNTDKTHRRLLEAVTDAVRQTQTERRNKQLSAPVRYALRIAGRLLSEPEPVVQVIEYHKAPEGWVSPFGTNGRSKTQ